MYARLLSPLMLPCRLCLCMVQCGSRPEACCCSVRTSLVSVWKKVCVAAGLKSCLSQVDRAEAAYRDFRLHDALEAALAISNRGNLYMEEVAPWTAFKKGSGAEKDAAAAALVAVLEAVRIVAVMMSPVTPGLSSRIYAGLGMSPEQIERLRWGDARWGELPEGQTMPKPNPVFARIDADPVTEAAHSDVSMAAQ